MSLGVEITAVSFLTSEQNWRADRLSRGQQLPDLSDLDDRFSLPVLTVDLKADGVLKLCDPKASPMESEESFCLHWARVRELVSDSITASFILEPKRGRSPHPLAPPLTHLIN